MSRVGERVFPGQWSPQNSASVQAILIKGVELYVEFGEARFVILEIVRDAAQRFLARVRGRHPLAHHFHDGVRAADADVFFAQARRAGRAHFVIHEISRADHRRIADAPRNFPRQPRRGRCAGNVAPGVHRQAVDSAGGRMIDNMEHRFHHGLLFGRIKKYGDLLFPVGA